MEGGDDGDDTGAGGRIYGDRVATAVMDDHSVADDGALDADAALLARIAAGDRTGLADLYARLGRPLLAYLAHLTPDRGLAEEILQDTLVAVWRSARTFEGRSGARAWIFGVAHRQAHNALRRRGLPLARPDEDDALGEMPDPGWGPEDHALARAGRDEMVAALGRLGPAQREVLVLALARGLTLGEVEAALGIPEGTVKSRLHYAKRALRAAPREMGVDR